MTNNFFAKRSWYVYVRLSGEELTLLYVFQYALRATIPEKKYSISTYVDWRYNFFTHLLGDWMRHYVSFLSPFYSVLFSYLVCHPIYPNHGFSSVYPSWHYVGFLPSLFIHKCHLAKLGFDGNEQIQRFSLAFDRRPEFSLWK